MMSHWRWGMKMAIRLFCLGVQRPGSYQSVFRFCVLVFFVDLWPCSWSCAYPFSTWIYSKYRFPPDICEPLSDISPFQQHPKQVISFSHFPSIFWSAGRALRRFSEAVKDYDLAGDLFGEPDLEQLSGRAQVEKMVEYIPWRIHICMLWCHIHHQQKPQFC